MNAPVGPAGGSPLSNYRAGLRLLSLAIPLGAAAGVRRL